MAHVQALAHPSARSGSHRGAATRGGHPGRGGPVADLPRRHRSRRRADFLDPKLSALRDPELLPGCARPPSGSTQAMPPGERIVVYGDYDVDGMTGTAILWLCLKLLGAEVSYYVPHRIDEG